MLIYIAFDISADDSSRVVLSVPNTSGTDYINASFVNVSNADTAYEICISIIYYYFMLTCMTDMNSN